MLRSTTIILIIGIIALIIGGCSGAGSPVEPIQNDAPRIAFGDPVPDYGCGDSIIVDLIAGQNYMAGYVEVYNDADYLYVKYMAADGWQITETHLAVANTLEGIPQTKKGNPKNGQFPYKMEHDPAVTEYTYVIDLDWDICEELFIAAHAVVQTVDGEGYVTGEETAWGYGEDFPGKNWAMYFNYEVESCCVEGLTLYDDEFTAKFYHPWAGIAYWKTVLSGVPAGFDVADGPYPGWCVDQGHYIYPNSTHTVKMYNSYADDLPSYAVDPDWDMVNYLLNHKHPDASIFDIQDAVWYFINGGHDPATLIGQAMVDDTLANGEGFVPSLCDGDIIVVIIDSFTETLGMRSQLTIIEVDCAD